MREQIALRVEPEMATRAELLAKALVERDEFKAFARMGRAAVLRMAILEGLVVLEQRYAAELSKKTMPRKKR